MMAVSYTNRKGTTYYLCQGETKTGKARYYFSSTPKGKEIEQIPAGYEISESVNGVVSLIKTRPRLIPPEEVALVKEVLDRHPQKENYRLDVKHDQIVIYEGIGPDADKILALFGKNIPRPPEVVEKVKTLLEGSRRFEPVMRFILFDPQTRTYSAERWSYLGSINDWVMIGSPGKLGRLARKMVPTLGKDAFFDLE
jgi:hypothetical protein